MSGYPGCTDDDMRALAAWLERRGWNPRQTQCFIPTPGTVATAMFYCGKDESGEPIAVARSDAARLRQHGILMGRTGTRKAKRGAPGRAPGPAPSPPRNRRPPRRQERN